MQSYRPQQIEAVMGILDAFKTRDVCVLDAPTGSGKTLIAETVRLMGAWNGLYVSSSKQLQDQFAHDYPYAKVIKGRRNYPTFNEPEQWGEQWDAVSCDDCEWTRRRPECSHCPTKQQCPYELAKDSAIRGELAVTNYSYALAELGSAGRFRDRGLMVLDEADTLEAALMGFVEAHVGAKRMDRYGWVAPKVTVESDWTRWITETVADIGRRLRGIDAYKNVAANREHKSLTRLKESLELVGAQVGESRWVFTGRDTEAAWKPVRVNWAGEYVYPHARKKLLMSATVISASSLVTSTGWNGAYGVVSLGSTFPVKNRLVIARGVADMARKLEGRDFDQLANAIQRIVGETTERVLVHTVSYQLVRELHARLRGPRFIYQTSAFEKEQALRDYRRTPGAVLVSPSYARGVDLPGDLCRVQIIAKIPFPNLGDRQVSARAYSGEEGKTWYTVETVRTIVQMCGRAVRSDTDWAKTYILDSQFERLWGKARGLIPKWWRDALVWEKAQ